MSDLTVDVRGVPQVQRMLAGFNEPQTKKVLRSAIRSAGTVVKRAVKAEAPYPDLKRAVWARTAKRGQLGYVIGHHKRNGGFIWHMVVGGTKAHGPRKAKRIVFWSQRSGQRVVANKVRGISPNPFVARAFASSEAGALAKMNDVIDKYLNSL